MSSTHSPHLLFSPKKKSNNNENNHSFSYEVISTLESTGVHFRTSIDPGSYVPAHLHHAIEIIYLLEGNLTVIMESSVREYHAGECILINSDIIHSTKCTSPNKAILFQIPLSFLSLYLPDADQLVFNLENPEESAVRRTKLDIFKETLVQMQIANDIVRKALSCVSTVCSLKFFSSYIIISVSVLFMEIRHREIKTAQDLTRS